VFSFSTTTRTIALILACTVALAVVPDSFAWTWPADGPVLRGFSVGDNPYAGGQHRGIDVAIEGHRGARAPAGGEVTFAGSVPTHGLTVTIATSDGYKASLTHLGPLLVKKGAMVTEGAAVAEAGPTGEAEHDVPYLHLGIRIGDGDDYVDPLNLLPRRGSPPPAAPAPAPAPAPTPIPLRPRLPHRRPSP
jgi:murein DD-endopeptidase MepM/ murein hydrolase activator NlpD